MSISQADKEHLVKEEIFNTFKQFNESGERAPLERFYNWIYSSLHPVAPAIIDTSNYKEQHPDSYSESEFLDRSTFALRKINDFNPHFFTMLEQRTINPVKLGVIGHLAKAGFAGIDAGILLYMWKSWSFNPKSAAFFLGFVATQQIVLRGMAIGKERIYQQYKRRQLAKKYIDAYGKEFMNSVVSPTYDVNKLAHMHNKLREH